MNKKELKNKHITDSENKLSENKKSDIAIIGMACRFPGAENYEEYWEFLRQGCSGIQEIPKERWDWKAYWGNPISEENKTNSKWGGFIKDVDAFEAGFFGISAREAEQMDPQQRIMLELTWSCLEDAGICPSNIAGEKVGVFVGAANLDYKELLEGQNSSIEAHYAPGIANSVIANRISYYFDFKGPSFPVDTACSSSLYAIHSAVEALERGECNMALAGGVSLLLTPRRYISFSKMGILSPTGSCKTFDESADGIVRGEGAGLILLKKLDKALLDGDSIYGILKGSAVNHSGRTYTMSYPSAEAQAEVISEAYRNAGITADSVSYIEAHGTGTPKGDPIEFEGLVQAFANKIDGEERSRRKYCGIGSVKTNIGHIEAAAGIAGVIKVLLSMKYKQLPPMLNFKKLNPRIQIEESPFYVVDRLTKWKAQKGADNKKIPRRAGVSAFGFAGTNAHILFEEAAAGSPKKANKHPYYMICLSAKTEAALKRRQQDLQLWLEKQDHDIDIADISATLMFGREHFAVRSAYIVKNIDELKLRLLESVKNGQAYGYFNGNNIEKGKKTDPFLEKVCKIISKELASKEKVDDEEYKNRLETLAEVFVKGYQIDWQVFFDKNATRISLPTYPFAKDRYWIPQADSISNSNNIQLSKAEMMYLHPLLHQNTSDLLTQKFNSKFSGNEILLNEHIVNEQKVLPGIAYIEMAREAVQQALGMSNKDFLSIELNNVVWSTPLIETSGFLELITEVYPICENEFAFEIYNVSEDVRSGILVQGNAVLNAISRNVDVLNIVSLKSEFDNEISKVNCYESLNRIGLNYGAAYQCIEKVYTGDGRALARLLLPESVSDTQQQFVLNPYLINTALQTSALLTAEDGSSYPIAPFSSGNVEIYKKCDSEMWAYVRMDTETKNDGVYKFDIDLCDVDGKVSVRLKDFCVKTFADKGFSTESMKNTDVLMFEPCWMEKNSDIKNEASHYGNHVVVLCEFDEPYASDIEADMSGADIVRLNDKSKGIAERYQKYAIQLFLQIQDILKNKPRDTVLIQIVVPEQNEKKLFSALSGLLKTAEAENPKLLGQTIEIELADGANTVVQKLKENSLCPSDKRIRYKSGKRYVLGWSGLKSSEKSEPIWKEKGVYLITGGAGGIGLKLVKDITASVKHTTLILTGRSVLRNEKQKDIDELNSQHTKIIYKQVDVSDKEAVRGLVESIKSDFGSLNGIIHCAGIINGNFIIKKSSDEFLEVLAPKVAGLVNLDQASSDMDLDFLMLFSSITGSLMGSPGHSDYGAANSFMDVYAEYRNEMAALNKCKGRAISINWPLWKQGGMQLDAENQKVMEQNTGLVPIDSQAGIAAMHKCWGLGSDSVLVTQGIAERIKKYVLGNPADSVGSEDKPQIQIVPAELKDKTLYKLKVMVGEIVKADAGSIDDNEPLETYGIDSIMITQLNDRLGKAYSGISKTLFYEYQNLNDLSEYLSTEYIADSISWTGIGKEERPVQEEASQILQNNSEFPVLASIKPTGNNKHRLAAMNIQQKEREPIAIIGMSGRFPKARNLKELWENLKSGKDCITEIPEERWPLNGFYHSDSSMAASLGKSYGKWGGFLEGFSDFDPLFFNISPKEALSMDPQERLFLEICWEVLEDAGYTKEQIISQFKGRMGVFAGITKTGYNLYGPDLWKQQEWLFPQTMFASVANRVSYLFNLHGPSMPVDTMCSSSLTAIHQACENIYLGECEMAIAGGVNLNLHPSSYVFLSSKQMLSKNGRCKSFGKEGNGYVPGEGVGAVLLKSLSQAIKDKDHIYAVIRATSINHGGKTNGYTVPNPVAQGELIRTALDKAGINARTISYIEAHGTGTELGDPIEITGLCQAFNKDTKDSAFCSIGSIKSNIGHLEAAAGIAGVAKIVLQMQHKKLVPSIHSRELNTNIDFERTPFIVQQELAEWKQPVVAIDGKAAQCPRRAGISSFGAGGSNAHVIIEEYISEERETSCSDMLSREQAIIVLSAKSEERLKEQAERLYTAVIEPEMQNCCLADLAYTLQIGREAMEERVGIVVDSIEELSKKLEAFIEGKSIENLFRGQFKRNKESLSSVSSDEKAIDNWINNKNYIKILELWVNGMNFDWNRLYQSSGPRRISLPTYPFARESYWIPDLIASAVKNSTDAGTSVSIHPLLHENTSDLSEQRFSSVFTGNEFFLKDHVINGKKFLPGAAYVEMARAAVEQALGHSASETVGIRLKNIVWTRPVNVEERPVKLHIGLFPEENGDISFEVYSLNENEIVVHSQGSAVPGNTSAAPVLNIEELQAKCTKGELSSSQCYGTFIKAGFDYGPGHQGVRKIYIGEKHVLAELSLTAPILDTANQFVLHPCLIDAAFQTSIGLTGGIVKPAIPFMLEEIEVFGRCPQQAWAFSRYSVGNSANDNVQKIDIDLCDKNGTVFVSMKGFMSRSIETEQGASENIETLIFEPHWIEAPTKEINMPLYEKHLVVLCDAEEDLKEIVLSEINGADCILLQSQQRSYKRFEEYLIKIFENIKSIIKDKPKNNVLIQVVIPKEGEKGLLSGISGLLKTAELESTKLFCQLIEIDFAGDGEGLVKILKENASCPENNHVAYKSGIRKIQLYSELQGQNGTRLPWKDKGIYVITGGAGGLGLLFANEIANNTKNAVLILTGRSAPGDEIKAKLEQLKASGATIEYRSTDVSDREAVFALIRNIRNEFGEINGIIHCAGIISDNLIIKKDSEEFRKVLAPKAAGVVNLDEASKDIPLDFFVLFSSAASMGNIGQADYSAANAFIDAYAEYRNGLRSAAKRNGITLSVNWPLWKEGGMHVDEETERMMREKAGMIPLGTQNGIEALYKALPSGNSRVIVAEGIPALIRQKYLNAVSKKVETIDNEEKISSGSLKENIQNALINAVSGQLGVKLGDIDLSTELNEYGFDSITFTEFANKLNQDYKLELTPAIFFEYPTLKALSEYLSEEFSDVLGAQFVVDKKENNAKITPDVKIDKAVSLNSKKRSRFAGISSLPQTKNNENTREPIAVVGISGILPGAGDIEEFWKVLYEGKDCITEIPKQRWDWRKYYGDPNKEVNRTNIKWGGFIDGVDEFDPLFFGISPKEAQLMDPQQRLLMTYVWKVIEDAGYSAASLSGTRTGIFAGTGTSGYGELLSRADVSIESYSSIGLVPSIGPNRMSYFLNIHGPSEPIETACSSSLVAIHRAVNAIESGSCDMAIAGGINTIVTPDSYISFSKAGMLCEDGRCKTFSDKANGYVRGEGAGMLFLKRLSDAEQSGDHIYGVIAGSAENHGGRANSLTSPNPKAQAEVLIDAYKKAGIDPETVGYIEAHGTGTKLGDPIEINGLKAAFKELYKQSGRPQTLSNYCGLGSIKTNIGHLELAAGIAGVLKVLLQLKHKKLVKSLYCDNINPYIELKDSPFYIVNENKEWNAFKDEYGNELPRRAGVSSFGIGGVNAHVVIEEYVPKNVETYQANDVPAIIVLSAKNEERLKDQAIQLLEAVNKGQYEESSLKSVAYTLQVGRDGMEERLAVIVSSIKELGVKLNEFLEDSNTGDIYRGQVKRGKDMLAVFEEDEDMGKIIDAWISKGKYMKLIELWVKGFNFDWNKLYGGTRPSRISLPTYPFATERYWAPDDVSQPKNIKVSAEKLKDSVRSIIKPIDIDTSTLL